MTDSDLEASAEDSAVETEVEEAGLEEELWVVESLVSLAVELSEVVEPSLVELLLLVTSTMTPAELEAGAGVAELDSAGDAVGLAVVEGALVLVEEPRILEMKLSQDSANELWLEVVAAAAAAAADEEGVSASAVDEVERVSGFADDSDAEVCFSDSDVDVCFLESLVVESLSEVVALAVDLAAAGAGVLSARSIVELVVVDAPGTNGAVPTMVCVTPLASTEMVTGTTITAGEGSTTGLVWSFSEVGADSWVLVSDLVVNSTGVTGWEETRAAELTSRAPKSRICPASRAATSSRPPTDKNAANSEVVGTIILMRMVE